MIDIDHLRSWVGKTETRFDQITEFPANALAATLDQDTKFSVDDPLPALWHWLYFLPAHLRRDAGCDGHAALGKFLPPVPLPRRMWAGGRLSWHAPIKVGDHLRKTSKVLSVAHKFGRTGDLVFVTVRHQIYADAARLLTEEHDIVYRDTHCQSSPVGQPEQAPNESDISINVSPDPLLLFRYSALTFNGHRIHYDHPFATQSEGYDGLVVHGPLLATMICDLFRQTWPDANLDRFEFKALATVCDTAPFSVHATRKGASVTGWIRRHDGAMAMKAQGVME